METNEMNKLKYDFNWWFFQHLNKMIEYYEKGKEFWNISDIEFGNAHGILRAAEITKVINHRDFKNIYNLLCECRYRMRCEGIKK